MASFLSLYPFNTTPPFFLNVLDSHLIVQSFSCLIGEGIVKRRSSGRRFEVRSTHSSPKILKSNRRSRYGQALSPFDTDDDEEEDDDDDVVEDDWSSPNVSLLPLPTCNCFPSFYKHNFVLVLFFTGER